AKPRHAATETTVRRNTKPAVRGVAWRTTARTVAATIPDIAETRSPANLPRGPPATRNLMSRVPPRGVPGTVSVFLVNLDVLRFPQEKGADDERHHRDHDRVPQAVIDITRLRDHGGREKRQHPSEPAVPDVVRQRHRGVPDFRGEQLDEESGDRSVDHRYVDHHDDHEELR